MAKVYTKTGDGGKTALIGGERVSKADLRVEAYGTVDELSAHLALLADRMRAEAALAEDGEGDLDFAAAFGRVQVELMRIEALLAVGRGGECTIPGIEIGIIARLESEIDAMTAGLPPVEGFTLPGGHPVVSQCHVCRTVCRRAERAAIRSAEAIDAALLGDESTTIEEKTAVAAMIIAAAYLNRLSDWLYTLGRALSVRLGVKEIYWKP